MYMYNQDVIKEMYIIYYLMEPFYYMKNLYNIAMWLLWLDDILEFSDFND